MKTIEEKIKEHKISMQNGGCISNYEEDDFSAGVLYGFEQGFKAGVEFSQQWINVRNELPASNEMLIVKIASGGIDTAFYNKDVGFIGASGRVSHWRKIELI